MLFAFESIIKSLPDNSYAAFVVHGGVIMAIMEAYAHPKKEFYDYHIEDGKFLLCTCNEHYIRIE